MQIYKEFLINCYNRDKAIKNSVQKNLTSMLKSVNYRLGPAFYGRPHDQMSYISPERAQSAVANLPVPVGMFLNMAHIPPRFYNQHQQALQGN